MVIVNRDPLTSMLQPGSRFGTIALAAGLVLAVVFVVLLVMMLRTTAHT
jgi:hypothetical protein